MYEPVRTAGTYAATGAATSGSVRPSSASRSSGVVMTKPPLTSRRVYACPAVRRTCVSARALPMRPAPIRVFLVSYRPQAAPGWGPERPAPAPNRPHPRCPGSASSHGPAAAPSRTPISPWRGAYREPSRREAAHCSNTPWVPVSHAPWRVPAFATLRSRRVCGLRAAPMAMGCPGSVAMVRARLHVVSGKGGTGKTTVAAALAIALASHGHRTLLCEVEGRQGIAQLFDLPPLSYKERKIAIAPGRGEVFGLAIDAEAALLEYLDLFYKLGRAGRTLDRIGAIDFATTVAPGMRDVLLTGKAYEATRRRDKRRQYVYDAVVLDAPPTGRISRFLNVNTEVAGLARMGPIHRHAVSIMRFLKSPSTAVHLVTLLEEMPVQEAADGRAELTANGLHVGAVFVNMVRDPLLPAKEIKQGR